MKISELKQLYLLSGDVIQASKYILSYCHSKYIDVPGKDVFIQFLVNFESVMLYWSNEDEDGNTSKPAIQIPFSLFEASPANIIKYWEEEERKEIDFFYKQYL